MQLAFVRSHHSIDSIVTNDQIPDFVVLSGPNGSGKSHLLEAIQQGATQIIGVTEGYPGPPPTARLFVLSQLVATSEGPQQHGAYKERWVQLHQQATQLAEQGKNQNALAAGSDELEAWLRNNLVAQRQLTLQALQRMLDESGKRLIDFTPDDYRTFSPLLVGIRDPFSLTVNELFLTYHERWTNNKFAQWLSETEPLRSAEPLSDEDFVARYGPPPWELLNETLTLVGLEYRFEPPRGSEETLTYEARPTHIETGTSVSITQLSSGEKTLMAVAMSLYGGTRLGEAIELPRVLLLDEADASLHPSMALSLLKVADDIFCKRYGVKVIMTTHSPSTVALAPEESIFTMQRAGSPRLRPATRDDALASLTVGVPTLSVRLENRRQVFTESNYDAACYQDLFAKLGSRLNSPISLEFIPSGSDKSGGSEAVKAVVTSLRKAGNPWILGVIDRDNRGGAPEGIEYLSGRHSLENLVLDPLLIGAFLMRERFVTNEAMGLPKDLRHFELTAQQAQTVTDFVVSHVSRAGDDTTDVTVGYVGGFSITVPRFYLDTQGHQIEQRLLDAFPELNRYGQGLKIAVIEHAVRDVPQFTPEDAMSLFRQLLGITG